MHSPIARRQSGGRVLIVMQQWASLELMHALCKWHHVVPSLRFSGVSYLQKADFSPSAVLGSRIVGWSRTVGIAKSYFPEVLSGSKVSLGERGSVRCFHCYTIFMHIV